MKNWEISAILLFVCVTCGESLDPYDNYREGSCSTIRWPLGSGIWNATFYNWVNNLRYIGAGNKYHFYRMAAIHPLYSELSENDFEQEFCYSRDGFISEGRGRITAYGLGIALAEFDVETRTGPAGTRYWDYTPRSPLSSRDVYQPMVTLSDGETFAFVTGCWRGSDQKVWEVISLVPRLSYKVKREILEHAIELGFRRENFVFLDYDTCWKTNPLMELRFGKGSSSGVRSEPVIKPHRPIKSLKEMADLDARIRGTDVRIEPIEWSVQDKYPEFVEVEQRGPRRSVVAASASVKRGGVKSESLRWASHEGWSH